jgi:hypothetical protein
MWYAREGACNQRRRCAPRDKHACEPSLARLEQFSIRCGEPSDRRGGLAHRVAKPLAAPKSAPGAMASQAARVARALARSQPRRSPSVLALFRLRSRLARRLRGAMCQAAPRRRSRSPPRSISAFSVASPGEPDRVRPVSDVINEDVKSGLRRGCAGAAAVATDVRHTRLLTRFEGCRTDHSRRGGFVSPCRRVRFSTSRTGSREQARPVRPPPRQSEARYNESRTALV